MLYYAASYLLRKGIGYEEPTTGVDAVSRREFWRLLSEFLSQGITIFMATPYLDEAERCSRVALMSEGRILALDEPNSLRAGFPDDLVEMLADPQEAAIAAASRDAAVRVVQTFGERLHIRVPRGRADEAMSRLAAACAHAGIQVTGLRPVPASLEDVFIDRVVDRARPECRMRYLRSRCNASIPVALAVAMAAWIASPARAQSVEAQAPTSTPRDVSPPVEESTSQLRVRHNCCWR